MLTVAASMQIRTGGRRPAQHRSRRVHAFGPSRSAQRNLAIAVLTSRSQRPRHGLLRFEGWVPRASLQLRGPAAPAAAAPIRSRSMHRVLHSACLPAPPAEQLPAQPCSRVTQRLPGACTQAAAMRTAHRASPPAASAGPPLPPNIRHPPRPAPFAESAKGAAPDPSPLLAAAHDAGAAPTQQAMSAPAVEVATTAAATPAPASDGAAASAADAEKASAEVAQAVAKAASKHSSPTSSSSSDSSKAKAAAAAPAAAPAEEEVQQVCVAVGLGGWQGCWVQRGSSCIHAALGTCHLAVVLAVAGGRPAAIAAAPTASTPMCRLC